MTKQPHHITIDRLELASLNHEGFCISCGDLVQGIEPSARHRTCPCCKRPNVFGLEQIVQMGLLCA